MTQLAAEAITPREQVPSRGDCTGVERTAGDLQWVSKGESLAELRAGASGTQLATKAVTAGEQVPSRGDCTRVEGPQETCSSQHKG